MVTDSDKLAVPLFVCGDSHKSLFSNAGTVPAWMCKPVAKNAVLQYAFEKVDLCHQENLGECFLPEKENQVTVPYLTSQKDLDDVELTRLNCPKCIIDVVLQLGYKSMGPDSDSASSKTERSKAPKKQQHLLK